MTIETLTTELASPADSNRWKVVHDVTSQVDRSHFWFVVRNERILKTLANRVADFRKKRYLEIGCGVGNVIGYLYENGLQTCTGWDINIEAIQRCRKRYPQIDFAMRDFLEPLKAVDQRWDIVGLFDALEHFEDDKTIVNSMHNLVAPGGTAIVTVPAMMELWATYDEYYGHYRRYNKRDLVKLLESAGFVDVRATYIMAPLTMPMLMRRTEARGTDREMDERFIRDVHPTALVNSMVKSVLRLEHMILGSSDLGFGTALLATATRR